MSLATINSPDGTGAGQPGQASASTARDSTGLKPGWGVSPERQQAIMDTLHGLVPRSGRLSPAQLRAITIELAARPELWADLVVHDPDVRWYLPLHRSNACDVWLLAWERGQDTDWHDHGGSSGSFAVAEGSLAEQYRVPERSPAWPPARCSRARRWPSAPATCTMWRTAVMVPRRASTPTRRRWWR